MFEFQYDEFNKQYLNNYLQFDFFEEARHSYRESNYGVNSTINNYTLKFTFKSINF